MYLARHILKIAIVPIAILLPAPRPVIERDLDRDIEQLQRAECEYRGISASFDELTRAYILQVYNGGHLLRWQAEPSPFNPETETFITAVFTAKSQMQPTNNAAIRQFRAESQTASGITWRYSTLAATRITPHSDFALDAMATFRKTVDDFLQRMVYAPTDIELRAHMSPDAAVLALIKHETVLLIEEEYADWLRVRQPSTTETGWLRRQQIQYIDEQHVRSN